MVYLHSLRLLFASRSRCFLYIFLVIISAYIWWRFTDSTIMLGNYGIFYTSFDIGLSVIMVLGFPLFLTALLYKGQKFGTKENLHARTGIGAIGGVVGTIISGASCCGLTFASYFGLMPLMSFLPFNGLELKIVGTLGLLYALHDILAHLDVCTWKPVQKRR